MCVFLLLGFDWCSPSEWKPHQSLLSSHQLLDAATPAEQLSEPPHRHLQVSQFHVVPSAEGGPLERPHGVPVQEEAWDGSAHRVDQAGTRLDLDGEEDGGGGASRYSARISAHARFQRRTCKDVPMTMSRSALGKSLV